jgi:serine/threonine protein phosphatase PrpC
MNQSKLNSVVRLDEHMKNQEFTDRAGSESLLEHCTELVISTLVSALPVVMDKLDDALFDRAGNMEQGGYLEIMRQVRVKRASIEAESRQLFKDSVGSTIERVADFERSDSLTNASGADLRLVGEDDFEETLAVTNMVQKIRSNCMQSLYALERRIGELLAVDELRPEDNPFGPEVMCNAFKEACAPIDANIEVRLITLKLFEHQICTEAEQLYCEINDYLVSQGVLPEIRHRIKVIPSAASSPTDHPSHEHGETATAAHHQPIQENGAAPTYVAPTSAVLLDGLRQVMDVNFANRAGPHTPGAEQLRVIGQLTHLQHGDTQAASEELAWLDVSDVHTGTVNVLRDLKQMAVVDGIGEIDALMFDIVAMMFDFILDDKKMPASMAALIGRLQIPMLKVAILDKQFFARKFHPARKFLNTIAEAAVGWREDRDRNDAIYSKLELMVGRILDEFGERIDVFTEVLAELEAFLRQEESRAESNASTSADIIQDRERLILARKNAELQITRCLDKARDHDFVQEFLIGHWKELLFIRHFEEGDTGNGWTSAIQTMDDLVWSIAPETADQDRNHLMDILPDLMGRVEDGMKQLGMPTELSNNFLSSLENLHVATTRSEVRVGDPDGEGEVYGLQWLDAAAYSVEELTEAQWLEATSYSVEALPVIRLAIERANDVIHGAAEARPECAGMGTTLVAVQFHDNGLTAAHVGDARLYRLRGDNFQRLTADHSLRQQLVDKGIYTAAEVEEKVRGNVITHAVGPESSVEVNVQNIATERDDLYLLCSDGLTDMVDDITLAKILRSNRTELATASRILVDTANKDGGRDNVSVVLVRVVDTCPESMPGDENGDRKAKLDMYGISDVGVRRSYNEDHIALDAEGAIAIVADGMGGCNAGEIASEMAVKIILEALRNGSVDAISITAGDGTRTSRVTAEGRLTESTSEVSARLDHRGDEIVIQGLASDIAYEPEEEDEYTGIVRDLEVGSWVEFYHVDGATTCARLAWVSPATGRHLFTDRKGMKVMDATVHGLALELKRGNVAVIEDVPLFDRAMGTITEQLHADGAQVH